MRAALITLLLLSAIPSLLCGREAREEKRIEHLLRTIEGLNGATFIRNGTEHTAPEAGKHLRMKLQKAGERVKTAEDFIESCASRSYLSGQSYKIRLADRTIVEAGVFLRAKLREFDAATGVVRP